MNNTGTYSQTDFVDNDNNWIEHNNTNRDDAGLDAHWGAEMVYDYFHQVHGRNSYNANGALLLNYVNANLIALGYGNNDNAFWDKNRMTYGRGTILNPLTSLDICAHEIAHGVTSNTARLAYRKESGAINEALSDIWAACIEAWAAPEKQRWLIGEDIGAIRSMNNPNLFNDPDTYLGTNWFNVNNCIPNSRENDNCGVHTNSGVINYWFFLLSEGGIGTNDIGNSFWVNAIGMNIAAAIVYRTQTQIINSSVEQEISFAQFREATITAASNLYGVGSNEVIQVTNAWHAVGVGNRYPMSIAGPSSFPDYGTFTIQNLPAGAIVQWSITNPYLGFTVTSNGSTATVNTNGHIGTTVLTAVVTIQNQPLTLTKSITSTAEYYSIENVEFSSNGLGGGSILCNHPYDYDDYQNTFTLDLIASSYNNLYVEYRVYKDGDVIMHQTKPFSHNHFVMPAAMEVGIYGFDIRCFNSLGGTSEWYETSFEYSNCGNYSYFSITPNPSSTFININPRAENVTARTTQTKAVQPAFDRVVITDAMGNVKLQQAVSKTSVYRIDVSRLPNGIYYLNLYHAGKLVEKKTIQIVK